MRIAYHAGCAGVARARKTEILAGRLAGDGAAGFENPRYHRGIDFRDIAFKQDRTVHHGYAGDADVILDRYLLAAEQTFPSCWILVFQYQAPYGFSDAGGR